MGTYGLGSPNDLFIGSFSVSITDIIHNGTGKNEAVLHHDSHLCTKRMQCHLGDIYAVNQYPAGIHVVETADQVDYGCLTRTGGTHQGIGFTCFHRKRYILQNGISFFITEIHMFKGYVTFDCRHLYRILRILYFHFFINGFKDTFQIGNCSEQGIVETCQGIDRVPETADVCCKRHQHTYRNAAFRIAHPTDTQHINKGGGDHGNHVNTGTHQKIETHCLHPGLSVASA